MLATLSISFIITLTTEPTGNVLCKQLELPNQFRTCVHKMLLQSRIFWPYNTETVCRW